MTTITSEVKPNYQLITQPIEAWEYTGQPHAEWPDWVLSKYHLRELPKVKKGVWALRDTRAISGDGWTRRFQWPL
jgi:hypothetical protein